MSLTSPLEDDTMQIKQLSNCGESGARWAGTGIEEGGINHLGLWLSAVVAVQCTSQPAVDRGRREAKLGGFSRTKNPDDDGSSDSE